MVDPSRFADLLQTGGGYPTQQHVSRATMNVQEQGKIVHTMAWAAYSVPFLAAYGADIAGFLKVWSDLIGAGIGALIGVIGGIYVGQKTSRATLVAAKHSAELADLAAIRLKWEGIQRNLLNHSMALERLFQTLTWFDGSINTPSMSMPYRLSLIENTEIKLPLVFDTDKTVIDFTGYKEPERLSTFIDYVSRMNSIIRYVIANTKDKKSDTLTMHDSQMVESAAHFTHTSCVLLVKEIDTCLQYAKEMIIQIEAKRMSLLSGIHDAR